jgi:hypothetical protein
MMKILKQILHLADLMIYQETLHGVSQPLHIKLKVLPLKMDVDQVFGMISARYQETLLMEIVVLLLTIFITSIKKM